MQLFVGLGNPGSQYAATRHNYGYRVVDAFAQKHGFTYRPGTGDYLLAEKKSADLSLVKPTGYMNASGTAVREALDYLSATPRDLMVIFDDIDLPLGSLRFREQGSAGGHKGMESIIYQLGTDEFPRLRLGIATDAPMRPSEDYVLNAFRPEDKALVAETIGQAVAGLEYLLVTDVNRTMTRFNSKPAVDDEND